MSGVTRSRKHIDQEAVEFSVDFPLDRWQQAEINKVELMTLIDRTNRFCTMDGVWAPTVPISLEQCRHVANVYAFVQRARCVAANLPERELIAFNDEQERRAERTVRSDQFRRSALSRCHGGECGRPI